MTLPTSSSPSAVPFDARYYETYYRDYARQNPGQALLIAAAAGFVIGLLVRGGRR